MTENMMKFLAEAEKDAAFAEKVNGADSVETVIALAKEKGFELTQEDLHLDLPTGELADEALDDVAGGLTARSMAGSMAHSMAGSMAGSMADSMAGSMANSMVGSMAGSMANSMVGSMANSMAGSMVGSMAGSFAKNWGGLSLLLMKDQDGTVSAKTSARVTLL